MIDTKFPVILHQSGDDWNKAMQELARQTMRTATKQAYVQFPEADPAKGGAGIRDERVKQFVSNMANKTVADFNKLTKDYNMLQLFKSLKQLGIQYYDFHGGNYGRRADGTLVLFDLGRSISKGAMPKELVERLRLLEFRLGAAVPIRALV